jgi:hypothetical protein
MAIESKTNSCAYTKIPESELSVSGSNFSLGTVSGSSDTKNATLITEVNMQDSINILSDQLSLPFYLLLFSFFAFVVLMSIVYVYHLSRFNLGDRFVKNYIPIYLFGLIILTVPLLFNLLS